MHGYKRIPLSSNKRLGEAEMRSTVAGGRSELLAFMKENAGDVEIGVLRKRLSGIKGSMSVEVIEHRRQRL